MNVKSKINIIIRSHSFFLSKVFWIFKMSKFVIVGSNGNPLKGLEDVKLGQTSDGGFTAKIGSRNTVLPTQEKLFSHITKEKGVKIPEGSSLLEIEKKPEPAPLPKASVASASRSKIEVKSTQACLDVAECFLMRNLQVGLRGIFEEEMKKIIDSLTNKGFISKPSNETGFSFFVTNKVNNKECILCFSYWVRFDPHILKEQCVFIGKTIETGEIYSRKEMGGPSNFDAIKTFIVSKVAELCA